MDRETGGHKRVVGEQADRPYSPALIVGDLIFVSGQVGTDPKTGTLAGLGAAEQTSQALDNLAALLAEAGSTLDDVVKTTVFLTDARDMASMNGIYRGRFGQPAPTRSTVIVAGLAKPEFKVEIEAIAMQDAEIARKPSGGTSIT